MSDTELLLAKNHILDILVDLDPRKLNFIEQWISSRSYKDDLAKKKNLLELEQKLVKIGNVIKELVPFGAEMSTENIKPPIVGDQADCNTENTCHVDEFLYDKDQVDELIEKEKLQLRYCSECQSRNIKDLIYISHSMSRVHLQYVFKVLLPIDLTGKQILDVGSRLGAVLYGAYHLSNASMIVGIEMNKECCQVQKKIIDMFHMEKINIVCADVMTVPNILLLSDVVLINVLDFFVDTEKHKAMWRFFKKHIRKGTYIVCNRSMVDTFKYLDLSEELLDWLEICTPNQIENEIFFNWEDCNELYLYTVR